MNRIINKYSVLAASVLLFLAFGIFYIWNVFVPYIMEQYFWSYLQASNVFYVHTVTFVTGTITSGVFNKKFGSRAALYIGGYLFSAGFLLSSFITHNNAYFLFLTVTIASLGMGIAYSTIISCVQKWWAAKKGFATGIILCALGSSTVLFAPLVDSMLPEASFGLSQTFRLLFFVFFITVTLFGIFIKVPGNGEQINEAGKENNSPDQYTPTQVIKSKNYYRALCILLFLIPLYYLVMPFLKVTGGDRGLSQSETITLIMLTGVVNVIGRFVCPKLTDAIKTKKVINLLYVLALSCSVLISFSRSTLYFATVLVIGFIYGGTMGIIPIIASDYFGTKHLSSNLGLFMIVVLIMSLLSPAITAIIEALGNSFIYIGVFSFIPGVLGILINNRKKRMT
jgi:OFA family oxalate/formate antiporter-like MFS transporter